uniref:Autophagy-related protein 4 n=1 Tax=Kwoniella dejecticola CBS 10117 TaxID=1296121 RepID=A0A1A6AG21_9TREE|nr:uncharacterized protein I303_00824 [Kwoniella dejecticola CBS 10117]OBR89004.1 hypothetical protein I303_00824 [Kwoniella dejecticola CBS 10117]
MLPPPTDYDSQSHASSISPSAEGTSAANEASTSADSMHHRYSNLPIPPPSDRRPPRDGKSYPTEGRNKLMKSLRKGKEREKSQQSASTGDIEEDWTLEGIPPPSSFHGVDGPGLTGRRASAETSRTVEGDLRPYNGITNGSLDDLSKKDKKSKGRGIVKKTSRLFARDRDKDKASEHEGSNGSSSLHPIPTSRQTSYSSAHSSDSQTTTATGLSNRSHNNSHFASLTRPMSNQSRARSPKEYQSHSRRASQDSTVTTSSWRARSFRTGSSPNPNEFGDNGVPIPTRQGSNLSASVPGLSRNALPQPSSQPPSGTSRSPETFPTRMSTWFSHLLPSTSTTTIQEGSSTASPPSQSQTIDTPPTLPPSPLRKPPSAAASFLNAARQRAVDGVRHLLDSEAQPDKCQDTIWVMGVGHSGWRPATPSRSPNSVNLPELSDGSSQGFPGEERRGSSDTGKPSPPSKHDSGALRPLAWSRKQKEQTSNPNTSTSPPAKGFSNLFTASTLSLSLPASMTSGSPNKDGSSSVQESPGKSKNRKEKEVIKWPEQFYDDFRSVVWCTYRSQYAPILSIPNNLLIPSPDAYYSAFGPPIDTSDDPGSIVQQSPPSDLSTRPSGTGWSWNRSEGGLTSDAGWGCMLRTGQSMLANALVHLHLGRDWRLPHKPTYLTASPRGLDHLKHYVEYVKILSWFLDDPSPLCPFSVHRMALIGKELGKEVGEWFGPSTAAGALKTLTNSFAPCGLAVSTATDSIIYRSDVYQMSNSPSQNWNRSTSGNTWGGKAVLILVGIRLGLDGVNPIYYESIKSLFAFPQSVGIAGGRPSSSYYFVGSQANSLFYLDPHLTRSAIPLEIPPAPSPSTAPCNDNAEADEDPVVVDRSEVVSEEVKYKLDVVDVDDISSDESSDSDISSSPSTRIRKAKRTSKQAKRLSAKGTTPPRPKANSKDENASPVPLAPSASSSSGSKQEESIPAHHPLDALPVDPELQWWINAYPEAALRTFHCEKVKKMPLSGLDPSMLLAFLVRNEADWEDFVERANKLPHKIFTVQDEPPSWDEDSDAGLESVSEPDEPSLDDEEIGGVPITSARNHSLNSASPSSSPMDEIDLSTTTVKPVDINAQTRNMKLSNDEEEEEEWTEGGTPSSQNPVLVERPTPTSVTSRQGAWPAASVTPAPAAAVARPTSSDIKVSGPGQAPIPAHAHAHAQEQAQAQEGIPFPMMNQSSAQAPDQDSKQDKQEKEERGNHEKRSTITMKRPLLEEQRLRTGSWIDPSPVRGEAPNGESLI